MNETTFRKAITFETVANEYLINNPKERSDLTYAINKVLPTVSKELLKFRTDWNEVVEDLRNEYREKDKDGNYKEREVGSGKDLRFLPVFLPEREKVLKEKVRALEQEWLDKPITVKNHLKPAPSTLEIKYLEPFFNFVIEPMTEDQIEAHYFAQKEKV